MIKFLQLIADEKDGFSFGKSWRYSEDSLVALLPILRVAPKKKRNYVLLCETKKVKISDTGQINKLLVENGEASSVYIRMGEIFAGGTQERMATRSYIIMPKEKVTIDVRCIHASKGINTGVIMTSGGIAPSSFDAHLCSAGFKMRNIEQREVWKNVDNVAQTYCCSMREMNDTTDGGLNDSDNARSTGNDIGRIDVTPGIDSTTIPDFTTSFTDDLKGNIDKFSDQIKSILQKVPYFADQVGVALIDLQGISAVECFDLKESWKEFKDEIIKKEGDKISKKQKRSPFEYSHKRAKEFVKILLGKAEFEEKTLFKSKDWRIIGLKNENYTGEVVELKNKPIHLLLVRNK